ncbi:hypothetical protein Tco_1273460 [Tanacetum coccineum]
MGNCPYQYSHPESDPCPQGSCLCNRGHMASKVVAVRFREKQRQVVCIGVPRRKLSSEDAQDEFVHKINEFPYGKSMFYKVKKMGNPSDLRDTVMGGTSS